MMKIKGLLVGLLMVASMGFAQSWTPAGSQNMGYTGGDLEVTGDLDVKGSLRAYPSELECQMMFANAYSWIRDDYPGDRQFTRTTGADTTASETSFAWSGCILLPDGRVMIVPRNSPVIGLYDYDTDTYTDGPAHGMAQEAYISANLMSDGRVILGSKHKDTPFGIFNPKDDSFKTTTTPTLHAEPDVRFIGGLDGSTYFTLRDSTQQFQRFNPKTESIEVVASPYGSALYTNLLPDGGFFGQVSGRGIYPPTFIDPRTGNIATGTALDILSTVRDFAHMLVLPDGRIFCSNYRNPYHYIYDPVKDTWTQGPAAGRSDESSTAARLLPDGRVVIFDSRWREVHIYNPAEDSLVTHSNVMTESYSYGGSLVMPDGKVILVESGSTRGYGIKILDFGVDTSANKGIANYLRLPYFNK